MNKQITSTYDTFIESMSPDEKYSYDEGLKDFLLSELILAAMEEDTLSVRKLAQLAGVSPTIVQEMKSGTKNTFNTASFFKILKQLGYRVLLERNGKIVQLSMDHKK